MLVRIDGSPERLLTLSRQWFSLHSAPLVLHGRFKPWDARLVDLRRIARDHPDLTIEILDVSVRSKTDLLEDPFLQMRADSVESVCVNSTGGTSMPPHCEACRVVRPETPIKQPLMIPRDQGRMPEVFWLSPYATLAVNERLAALFREFPNCTALRPLELRERKRRYWTVEFKRFVVVREAGTPIEWSQRCKKCSNWTHVSRSLVGHLEGLDIRLRASQLADTDVATSQEPVGGRGLTSSGICGFTRDIIVSRRFLAAAARHEVLRSLTVSPVQIVL